MCVLAVDIGTTALKAALITNTGNVAAFSKQPLAQGDHAALGWMTALKAAMVSMRVTFPASKPAMTEVSAIAISGNGPTLVAPDGTTLLWNASVPSAVCHGQKSIFLPRIAAFRTMHPNVWTTLDRGHPLCSGPEFLAYQLTGHAVTVLPEARYMGVYWDDGRLDSLGIPRDILPPFAPPTKQVGMYNGVPVFCAGPDFIAAMIGTGSLEPGRMYDCAGSSEGVNLVVSDSAAITKPKAETPSPSSFAALTCTTETKLDVAPLLASLPWRQQSLRGHSPKQPLRILPSVVPGLWNAAVIIPESGSIFVNYRRIVEAVADREVPYAELIDRCMARHDSDGYEILQYMAENFRDAVNALPRMADCIVVTGGQARNAQWMQMKADVVGVPLAVMSCPDAELVGDAAAALVGLGVYPLLQDAAHAVCHIDKVYRPADGARRSVSRSGCRGKSESL